MDNAFIAKEFKWDCRSLRPRQRLLSRVVERVLKLQLAPLSFCWENANVEARMNVFHLVSQTAFYRVPGDVVEIGCNSGEMSIVIRKVLDTYAPHKTLHVYDSFEGLPEPAGDDSSNGIYKSGDMSASRRVLVGRFEQLGLDLPHIHQGWFEDTIPSQMPDQISFAYIDADLYSSTKHVLPHVYARLSPGAICAFGVYYDETVFRRDETWDTFKSPGVKRATDEFFADKPESVSVLYANEYSNGYFRKRLDEA